jgi:hypothetical protein
VSFAPPPRGRPRLAHVLPLTALVALCALVLSACGNTLQDQPVPPSFLEPLVTQEEFPVYWLGGLFHRLAITSIGRDPSGAYEIAYGNCIEGGQSVCVTPLQIVTSPDNSFRPGGSTPTRIVPLRGEPSVVLQSGRTIEVPTGAVVVDVYADSPTLARAAAETMVTINAPEPPGTELPRPLPATDYAQKPLPSQQPPFVPLGYRPSLR